MSLERVRNLGWPGWGAIALALGLALALLVPGLIRVAPTGEPASGAELPTVSTAAMQGPELPPWTETDDASPQPRSPMHLTSPAAHESSEPDAAASLEPIEASELAAVATQPAGPASADEDASPPVEAEPLSQTAPATELLGIDTTTTEDGEGLEILLRADGTISSPHAFTIDGPDRLVVDLEHISNAMGRSVVPLDSGRVTRVRSGLHDDTLRLVFDAGDVESAFDPRRLEPVPDGLLIMLGSHAANDDESTAATGAVPRQAAALPPVASIALGPIDHEPTVAEPAAPPAEAHPPVASIMPSAGVDAAMRPGPRPSRELAALPSYLNGPGAAASGAHAGLGLEGDYDCIIEPYDVVEVGSALTAVVHSVAVERSDFVQAGQVLAELESSPERAAVEVARARAAMDADVMARQARMELSRKKQKRADQLFESQTLSADLRDEIRTEAEVAKAVLEEAREAKQLTELEYREAIERLDEHTIHSPISGVVVERLKSPGEVVKEETIVVVAQIDPLRVEVILPAAAIGTVQPGMRAEVFPELPKAGVQVASVTVVDRVIDATSGTFGVRLELPNPDHAVPSGLRCQVRFLPVD